MSAAHSLAADQATGDAPDEVLDRVITDVRIEERWVAEVDGYEREIPSYYLGKWPQARRQIRHIITTEWSDS